MLRILVIGMGYLGAPLALRSQQLGYKTLCASHPQDSPPKDKSLAAYYSSVDIGNKSSVAALAAQLNHAASPPERIFLCASSRRGSIDTFEHVFVQGSQNITQYFPDSHIIFCSSTSLYEQTQGEIVTELSPTAGSSPTTALLRQAEEIILNHRGTVARLGNLYGPHRSFLLQQLLDGTARQSPPPAKIVNHIHRDDAISALLFLATQNTPNICTREEIYNITDSSPMTQEQLYRLLCSALRLPLPPIEKKLRSSKRPYTHKYVNNDKLRRLGWEPRYPSFLSALNSVLPTLTTLS